MAAHRKTKPRQSNPRQSRRDKFRYVPTDVDKSVTISGWRRDLTLLLGSPGYVSLLAGILGSIAVPLIWLWVHVFQPTQEVIPAAAASTGGPMLASFWTIIAGLVVMAVWVWVLAKTISWIAHVVELAINSLGWSRHALLAKCLFVALSWGALVLLTRNFKDSYVAVAGSLFALIGIVSFCLEAAAEKVLAIKPTN